MLVRHEAGRLSHPSGRVRGMCKMCEGFSQETNARATTPRSSPSTDTWSPGSATVDPPHWTYTVGLLDLVGHPELIVAGPHFEVAGASAQPRRSQIVAGRSFGPGDTMDLRRRLRALRSGIRSSTGSARSTLARPRRSRLRAGRAARSPAGVHPAIRDLPRELPATRSRAPIAGSAWRHLRDPSEAAAVTYT